jgi:hypothetical protein
MSVLRQLFGPSRKEIWQQLCAETGADFVDGGFWKGAKVQAAHEEWTITLDTYVVSSGKSSTTYTRMRAPYVNPDGFRFSIHRRHFFTGIAEMLGGQDVKIGDDHFDHEFVIKGTDEEKLRTLLANEKLRDLIAQQPKIRLSVKDDEGWFGPSFPNGVDELHFVAVGVIKDIERLKALFDLFSETLDQLCIIGSAYEGSPNVRL